MTLPVTREHRNLRNAIDAYTERHGSHPDLDRASRHLDSTGGGYEQDRIGVDDRTPGQKAAARVRESSATARNSDPQMPHDTEVGAGTSGPTSANPSRANSSGERGYPSGRPTDRSGQQEQIKGPRATSAGQQERKGAVRDRTGQDGPTQRTSRARDDGNTGDGRRENFNSVGDRARKRFGK